MALLLLPLQAAATEELRFEGTFQTFVEAQYPMSMTLDEVMEQSYKGSFENKENREQVKKVLDLRGKKVITKITLVQVTDGTNFALQVPGISLPAATPELMNELYKDGVSAKWRGVAKGVIDVGHIDEGWTNSLVWSPMQAIYFQYVPVGLPWKCPNLKPNEVGLLEVPYEGFEKPAGPKPLGNQRNFVIRYSDPSRSSIVSITGYWHERARTNDLPFFKAEFKGSRVDGKRHRYEAVTLTRYTGNKISSIEQLAYKGSKERSEPVGAEIPLGQNFLDRRLGDNQHEYYAYSGRISTRAELEALAAEGKTAPPSQSGFNAWRVGGGLVLIVGGLSLWAKTRRMRS